MLTQTEATTENGSDGSHRRAASSPRIRLLVVDDHRAVRLGLRQLLEDQPDFDVVGVVETADDALAVAESHPIDVAIVDYQLGGRNGLWVSRKLKRLQEPPQVVIYSAYASGHLAASCVIAEADGLVSKGGLGSELCDAIRSVARGKEASVSVCLAADRSSEHVIGRSDLGSYVRAIPIMRVLVGPQPRPREYGSRSCSRSTISIRVTQPHPTCHDASPTRASVSAPEMGSSSQLIFSVDPID